jgi:hypothetical protein
MYAPLRTIKDWYKGFGWEDFIRGSTGGRTLSQDIEWALEILARAGQPDNQLFDYFALAVGSEREARLRANTIVQRNPGLAEDVAAWLGGRVVPRKSTLGSESQYQKADELLAGVLIQQQAIVSATDQLKRDVLSRLRIMDEKSAAAIGVWIDQLGALVAVIETLVTMRGLSLVGSIGDVVEFSALEHELTDPERFGVRTVRIVRPMVVAQAAVNLRRVVQKALVEPV